MRRLMISFVLITLLLSTLGLLPSTETVEAQSETTLSLTISFDEVAIDDLCANAINAYAPDITIALMGDGGAFGPLIVADFGEASGIAPECQISPGDALVLRLNRPAYAISFNRYGTVGVTLTSNGASVGSAYDVSSGLGGRYERTEFVGFDQIILAEDSGTTPLLIDELEITFDAPAVTAKVDFGEIGLSGDCADAINTYPLLNATSDTTTNFAPPKIIENSDAAFNAPLCEFDPGNSLSITLPQPAIALSFDIFGGADLQLFLNGAQIGATEDIQGLPFHFSRTRIGGFDQIILTEPSGFSSFELDNFAVTFVVDAPFTRIDFDGATSGDLCADFINTSYSDLTTDGTTTTDFDPPFISDTSEAGGLPACEFNPGNSLIISLPANAQAISFTSYGGAEVQLLSDDGEDGPADINSGLPRHYARIDADGFSQIIISETSGFSSFKIDNIQIIYTE